MKNVIKKLVLLILYYSFGRKKQNGLLIITYHRITNISDYQDPLKVSQKIFNKQIEYLQNNYTIISGEQLVDCIKNNKTLPNNSCIITFDDGWADNYTNALPILKKHDVPAIVFVSTDFISSGKIFWHEQLQELLKLIPTSKCNENLVEIMIDWPVEIPKKIIDVIKTPFSERQVQINALISLLKKFEPQRTQSSQI